MDKLKRILDERLIRHFREPHPAEEMSRASAVGIFWGLTPLAGIQMYLVTATWIVLRFFHIRFNLGIGIAWVWITNPVTIPFLYYLFYVSGVYFFRALGLGGEVVGFAHIQESLTRANSMGPWNGIGFWLRFLLYELGWPMLIGSFLFGLICAGPGYYLTGRLVNGYRRRQAARQGITLSEWEAKYVRSHGPMA